MSPDISIIGITNARPPQRLFGIHQADRLQHVYVIGKTGTGKSTLLKSLFLQDAINGKAAILIDPHGDLADQVVKLVPASEHKRLIYLDCAKSPGLYGYNPLRNVPEHLIPLAASGIIETFQHHFGEKSWGSRMEHILRNLLYALLEQGDANLPDILRMLSEKDFRQAVTSGVRNPQVRYFFQEEFSRLWGRTLFDAIAPIQNKVGAFLTDPRLVSTLVSFKQEVSFRRAMDDQRLVVVNLARGIMGSDTSDLLGSLFTSAISLAALSRQNLSPKERTPTFLYLDEFEHLLTKGTADMLSIIRKMGIGIVLANQYLAQLDDGTREAVMGNVGTLVVFRVGPEDASILERYSGGDLLAHDFEQLANFDLYAQMMIEGAPGRWFSGRSLSHTSI
jgi:energy-coupling factor transporter ATP-binding protein EcfA2